MARIETTGNESIDQATAEIAVALRNACRVTCSAQDHYDEAMRLRDEIMNGTRELSADEPTPEEAEQAHDIYVWERARGMHPEDTDV